MLWLPILFAFTGSVLSAKTFVHPGARSSAQDLDFVKAKIASGAQPWTGHLSRASNAGSDARALGKALNWYFTGDAASAEAAIAALKAWNGRPAYTPPPDGQGNQSSLEGAWAASVLAPAAEILSLYPGWTEADRISAKGMFRTLFLPALVKMSYWNGNVDLTQIDALLSIAVFLEDEAAFDLGIERLKKRLPAYFYLASDDPAVRRYGGSSDAAWGNYSPVLKWTDGLTQESCRDNGHHTQFAIAAALAALETAYIQGVDLYTPNQERMVDAMELLALQLSSRNMQGTCGGAVTASRFNTLEIGYNHYHNRKGIALPETWNAITRELRNGSQQFNMFHETLTHGDIAYGPSAIRRPPGASAIVRSPGGSFSWRGRSLVLRGPSGEWVNVGLMNLLGVRPFP